MFKSLVVETTNYCNLNCFFCPHSTMKRKKQHISLELFEKIVTEIEKINFRNEVYLSHMGEPLLHPRIFDIFKICKNHSLNYVLTTNGKLLTKQIIKTAFLSRISKIYISLQAFYFSNQSEKYKMQIFKAVKFYLNNNFENKLILRCRIFGEEMYKGKLKDYKKESDWLIGFIKELTKYVGLGEMLEEEISNILNKKTNTSLLLFNKVKLDFGVLIHWPNPYEEPVPNIKQGSCLEYKRQFVILSNGDVVLCCFDFDGFTKIGNVKENTILEILNSKRTNKVHNLMDKKVLVFDLCKLCQVRLPEKDRILLKIKSRANKFNS